MINKLKGSFYTTVFIVTLFNAGMFLFNMDMLRDNKRYTFFKADASCDLKIASDDDYIPLASLIEPQPKRKGK